MLAVFITRRGGPETVVVQETPKPKPQAGEALVRVSAAGVNYADVICRSGFYPDAPRFPFIPGYEFSGTVEEARSTTGVKEGDRVLGVSMFKAQAEYVVVPENQLFRLSDELDFITAAALPVNYLTAYFALFNLGGLKESQKVLIHACAGGVGTAAVQLARLKQATIFGTASNDEKCEYLKKIGVDFPINYRKEDFAAAVRRQSATGGIDLVLDPVGGPTFRKNYRLLAPGGRVICYGVADLLGGGRNNIFRLAWKFLTLPRLKTVDLMQDNRGVLGLALNRLLNRASDIRQAVNEILDLYTAGMIKPEISRIFDMKEVSKAHALLQSGESYGKTVLNINDEKKK